MTHHINAFFEGHENATQVASALSKYAERTTLFLKLTGADVSTGPNAELSRISGQLVEARSDLGRLRGVVSGYGEGNENAGIRKLIALLEQTAPGLKGLFDPAILLDTGDGQRVATRDPTLARANANAASLNQLLRDRERTWGREGVTTLPYYGPEPGGGVTLLGGGKAELQAELDELMAAKAEEARLATLYNGSDWKQARDLEAQRDALTLELRALPVTSPPSTAFARTIADLQRVESSLATLKGRRAPGAARTPTADPLRDRRMASLQDQIKEANAAEARQAVLGRTETVPRRLPLGMTVFNPVGDLAAVTTTGKPSSTPELDKLGAFLRDEVMTVEAPPPPPVTRPMSSSSATTTPISNTSRGGTVTLDADNRVGITTPDGRVFPGRLTATGMEIYPPGTKVPTTGAVSIPPIAIAPPTPLPADRAKTGPGRTVTYADVPIDGLPGDGTAPPPGELRGGNILVFRPPERTVTGGGGGGSSGQFQLAGSGGGGAGVIAGPGMGWGESEKLERLADDGPRTAVAVTSPTIDDLRRMQDGYANGNDPGSLVTPYPPRRREALRVFIPYDPNPKERRREPVVEPTKVVEVVSPPGGGEVITQPTEATTPQPPQPPPEDKPPAPPPPPPPPPLPPPEPPKVMAGFGGTWSGGGGCGFSRILIAERQAQLAIQGLPGNGEVTASSNGTVATGSGVNMFGKPGHDISLRLSGDQISFQASSNAGSCSDNLRRQ